MRTGSYKLMMLSLLKDDQKYLLNNNLLLLGEYYIMFVIIMRSCWAWNYLIGNRYFGDKNELVDLDATWNQHEIFKSSGVRFITDPCNISNGPLLIT